MVDNLITHFQIFGIGLSFAIAGPCLLMCTPILVTYISGKQEGSFKAFVDILVFLSGRLFAYVLLGALAGFSGAYLRGLTQSGLLPYLNVMSGVISILLGIFVLFNKPDASCAKTSHCHSIYDFGSILLLGFIIGISPCMPLTALLFEIALISKSALDGAMYALSFGLGTFIAGLIIVSAVAGLLRGIVKKLINSKEAVTIFKVICSLLLVIFGAGLIQSGLK